MNTFPWLSREHYQRAHRVALQFLAATQEAQFNEERDFQDLAAQPLDQHCCCGRSAARGQQVVNEQDPVAGLERVNVNGNGGCTVFEVVLLFVSLIRELSLLSNRDEASAKLHRRGGRENEPARVDAHDGVQLAGLEVVRQQINATGEEARVGKNWRDVF